MALSLEEMGQGYIQSVKYRIERAQTELQEQTQHLQECENVLQFEASNDKRCSSEGCDN